MSIFEEYRAFTIVHVYYPIDFTYELNSNYILVLLFIESLFF